MTCLKVQSCHVWKDCGKPWIHTGYPILEIKGKNNFPKIQEPPQISGHQNYDVKHILITKDQKNMRHQYKKFSHLDDAVPRICALLLQMQFKLGMPTCTD